MNQSLPPKTSWWREPFLHFLLLGGAIFALNTWRESKRPVEGETAKIEINAAVIERLRSGYERQFGSTPDEEELRGLVTAHIREEVLYRKALALGLEQDDSIVRRRLAQKMEFLTDDVLAAVEPEEAALQKHFNENAARYAQPGRVTFRHVYFSKEKRGAHGEAAAREALAALEKGAGDESFGDSFLHGFEFSERGEEDIVALFGSEFAKQIAAQTAGAWHGPVASSYGIHLVKIDARSAPRPVTLAEVRATVARDFNDERRRATNREVFERLKERYQVVVDETALRKAAGANPQLRTAQAR